ncbi:NAD(P)H-dependent glycerol-3-phosphate dehydrogenase [soil metagenome]
MLKNVTVIGSGSWATALVKLFSDNGTKVAWLVRNKEQAEFIKTNGHNPRYLSFAMLNMELIQATTNVQKAIDQSGLIVFAVPSAYFKKTVEQIDPELLVDKQLAVSIKGLIPGTGFTPSLFLQKYLGKKADAKIMVMGGPCHAEEVANQKSTYITISAEDPKWVDKVCKSLKSNYTHAIANNDPIGIEYASIIKNIIGISTGIANGLHYGDNFQAVLVSNAMREAARFLNAVDPRKRDLFHSAYFGDLLVTAYSDFSRNRTLGKLVGRGIHVNKALQAMEMIAEGFHASKELAPFQAKSKIKMPVVNAVHRILHQHANPYHEFKLLENQLT